MKHTPRQTVGVMIAAYNAADTIARAVGSALACERVAEVIVVDDASSDLTAAAAEAADDGSGRLTVIRQTRNQGPAAARNTALRRLTTAWVTVLDADDYLLPGRFERMTAMAESADLLADLPIRTFEGEAAQTPEPWPASSRVIDFEGFVLGNLSRRGQERIELGFVKPLMRRAFLQAHGLAYRDLRLGEDYELYARALGLGARMRLTGPQGYVAVVRADSLSGRHSIEDLRRLRDCDRSLAALPALSEADRRALRRHSANVDCKLQWRLLIEAVKHRHPGAAIATFRSPQVGLYLIARLAEQAWLRGIGKGPDRRPPPTAPTAAGNQAGYRETLSERELSWP